MGLLKGVESYSALEESLRIGVHRLAGGNLTVVARGDRKGWDKGSSRGCAGGRDGH
jgi:hypothetical protein